jgi:hypothetical protein
MDVSLDRFASVNRRLLGRLSCSALVLGFCALACLPHPALGQAQLGAAESCFDQGPDKLPPASMAAIPSLPTFTRVPMPDFAPDPAVTAHILASQRSGRTAAAARILSTTRIEKPKKPARPAAVTGLPEAKAPESTLTASR